MDPLGQLLDRLCVLAEDAGVATSLTEAKRRGEHVLHGRVKEKSKAQQATAAAGREEKKADRGPKRAAIDGVIYTTRRNDDGTYDSIAVSRGKKQHHLKTLGTHATAAAARADAKAHAVKARIHKFGNKFGNDTTFKHTSRGAMLANPHVRDEIPKNQFASTNEAGKKILPVVPEFPDRARAAGALRAAEMLGPAELERVRSRVEKQAGPLHMLRDDGPTKKQGRGGRPYGFAGDDDRPHGHGGPPPTHKSKAEAKKKHSKGKTKKIAKQVLADTDRKHQVKGTPKPTRPEPKSLPAGLNLAGLSNRAIGRLKRLHGVHQAPV